MRVYYFTAATAVIAGVCAGIFVSSAGTIGGVHIYEKRRTADKLSAEPPSSEPTEQPSSEMPASKPTFQTAQVGFKTNPNFKENDVTVTVVKPPR